jgi:hypothetical protein
MKPKIFFCLLILLILVTAAIPVRPVIAQTPTGEPAVAGPFTNSSSQNIQPAVIASQPVAYYAIDKPGTFSQGVPQSVQHRLQANLVSLSTFTAEYVAAGGHDDGGIVTCSAFPTEAKTPIEFALSVWANLIYSNVPIKVQVCWANLGAGYLGVSYSYLWETPFTNAPRDNTVYSIALANALANSDYNSSAPEIVIILNSQQSFYYGTDDQTPGTAYNLATVALHEIGHGMGFSGSMREYPLNTSPYNNASWGYAPSYDKPNMFDAYTYDGANRLIYQNYSNFSTNLMGALTSGNVYFTGPASSAANGGQKVKLYAPPSWSPGSSYSHLDFTTFDNTNNSLMVYAMRKGVENYNPGPVTLGVFADIGWPFPPTNLVMTNSTVAENLLAGTAIGAFVAKDPNTLPVETFTYALADGGVDNALFQISGSTLLTNAIFNYEAKNSYSIRVRVTDHTNLSYEQNLTITITKNNHAPTDIALSAASVPENQADALVGTLTTSDSDYNETFTYSLACSGTDNASFKISGTQLLTNAALNYEVKSSLNICVHVIDSGGSGLDKAFTISVTDVNEMPTKINTTSWIALGATAGSRVAILNPNDPYAGQYVTLQIFSGPDKDEFNLVNQQLYTVNNVTEEGHVYHITIRVSDGLNTADFPLSFTVIQPKIFYLPSVLR